MISIENTKKFKIESIFFLIIIFYVFFSSSALALAPLVPCGRAGQPACTTCDILVLGKNVSDFILFYMVPALATLLFIYAGFLILLGGGITSQVSKGQSVFRTTVYGLAIIFLAWLMVNTVLRTVAGDQNIANEWWKLECKETIITSSPAPSSSNPPQNDGALAITTASLSDGVVNQGYFQNLKATGGQGPYLWSIPISSSPLPDGLNFSSDGTISGTPTTEGNYDFTVQVDDSSTPKLSATKDLNIRINPLASVSQPPPSNAGEATCTYSNYNLCQPDNSGNGNCPTNSCQQYSAAINSAANSSSIGGLNMASLIRAIMYNESGCNISAISNSNPPSCGLVQLQPDTANRFRSQCGVTNNVTCDWLRNSANAAASICIGAQYLRSIASGTCGSEVRNIAAGYNGGSNSCSRSVNCRNDTSCAGGRVQRWECLYDDDAHQTCNTGFDETRGYAPKILACYNRQ